MRAKNEGCENQDDDELRGGSGARPVRSSIRQSESYDPGHSGADESSFHYSRAERLSMAGNTLGRVDNRPWHKRNRGNLIFLLDIGVIVLVVIGYNLFLKPDPSRNTFENQEYLLRAVEFDGQVLATLRITPQEILPEGSAGVFVARAELDGLALEPQTYDVFSGDPEQPRILRFRFPEDFSGAEPDQESRVQVRIDANPDSDEPQWDISLTCPIELE